MSDQAHALVAEMIEDLEPGSMVTKFVLIAEVIDPDGQRAVWSETHDGASSWDTLGLLQYGLQTEQSSHVVAVLDSDE